MPCVDHTQAHKRCPGQQVDQHICDMKSVRLESSEKMVQGKTEIGNGPRLQPGRIGKGGHVLPRVLGPMKGRTIYDIRYVVEHKRRVQRWFVGPNRKQHDEKSSESDENQLLGLRLRSVSHWVGPAGIAPDSATP